MDFTSYIATNNVLKKVDELMICGCFWFGCVFLSCDQTMYNVLYVYVICTNRDVSNLWMGYVICLLMFIMTTGFSLDVMVFYFKKMYI